MHQWKDHAFNSVITSIWLVAVFTALCPHAPCHLLWMQALWVIVSDQLELDCRSRSVIYWLIPLDENFGMFGWGNRYPLGGSEEHFWFSGPDDPLANFISSLTWCRMQTTTHPIILIPCSQANLSTLIKLSETSCCWILACKIVIRAWSAVPVHCWTVKCGLTLYSCILDEPNIQETLVTQLHSCIYHSKTTFIPKTNQIFP